MIRPVFIVLLSMVAVTPFAQQHRFSIEANYGICGNFFVINADYGGAGGAVTQTFTQKNFIGTIGGAEIKYKISARSRLGFAYSKSVNSKEINYNAGAISAAIINWNIRHTDKFFQLFYERDLCKKSPSFKYHAGIFYLRMNQQEIEIGNYPNGGILFEERNFKTYGLEEAGAFVGLQFSKYIDTKFELGIKTRFYYLLSTASAEAITLTPALTYHF